MEQVLQRRVLHHVKEEISTQQQEQVAVQLQETDTMQQDVIVQEIIVQEEVSVLQETTA